MDHSVKIIKDLMQEDHRIKLIKNTENRGTLYSKTRGILNAKGKYIMTLDHDDLYAKKNAFSSLYYEAEKYNLDLLGFASVVYHIERKYLERENYISYLKIFNYKQTRYKKKISWI